MTKFKSGIKNYALFFFMVLGMVLTVYLGYMIFSPYITNIDFSLIELAHAYLVAVLLTTARFLCCSDWAVLHLAYKARFCIHIIPAAAALGLLSYDIGLQEWMFAFYRGKTENNAAAIFITLLLLTFIAMVIIWFFVDGKLQEQEKKYNAALAEYKKNHHTEEED